MNRLLLTTDLVLLFCSCACTWQWTDAHPAANPEVSNSGGTADNSVNELDVNYTQALHEFKYGTDGPASWYHIFKECAGRTQSPINIDTTVSLRVHQPHLFWWNYHLKPNSMTLTNNGHTVVLSGIWDDNQTPYFWHANAADGEDYFQLDHIHFHWGTEDTHGSEHLVNSLGYPLELHAVHYNRALSGVAQALTLHYGVKVVSIFYMLSESDNPALESIISALPNLENPSSVALEPLEVGRLIPKFKAFITYNGSLTTPPCAEAVTWLIRLAPATISKRQLLAFRKLRGHFGETLAGNVRPVQPVNGRTVLHVS